jgi:hypothetical protein
MQLINTVLFANPCGILCKAPTAAFPLLFLARELRGVLALCSSRAMETGKGTQPAAIN